MSRCKNIVVNCKNVMANLTASTHLYFKLVNVKGTLLLLNWLQRQHNGFDFHCVHVRKKCAASHCGALANRISVIACIQ